MAAGLGFKTFTTGEVLSAADVNGYLMQGVLVFASAAARNAAITSPQEGQFAFTKDTNGLWYYDGAAWVASGAAGDIEGVSAGVGISGGGTSGTVTVTNSMATAIDAKGDLIAGTGADAFSRLAVGANDTVLIADSTAETGIKWGTPAAGTASLSLVASGTLSGASLTLSSLSTYDNLVLIITNLNQSNSAQLRLRVNNNSTSNYWAIGFYQTGASTSRLIRAGDDSFLTAENVASGANGNEFVFELRNCKAAGFTSFGYSGSYNSTRVGEVAVSGMYAVAEAVSSLVLAPSAGTFSGGNYRIYGG